MTDNNRNVILTGFMGTGKSTVASLVAGKLGRTWVDMDSVLAERAGMAVSDIFARYGEAEFRKQEMLLGAELSQKQGLVISTGGGSLLDPELARLMTISGVVICLDAEPAALLARLHDAADRPLLAAFDREQQLTALWRQRRPRYAQLPLHLDTTYLSCEIAAARVCTLLQAAPRSFPVSTPQGAYQVLVMNGVAAVLGDLLKVHDVSRRILIVSNERVWPLHGESLQRHLADSGYQVAEALIPDGERYKTLDTLQTIYAHCVAAGLDRRSVIIALGGGVVTDMAGFAAATYLRGIPFIPMPTSLLAMVDAGVGGKVAVDLPQGKNLVGAFAQPLQVLIDPDYLATLPQAERDCGLVEIIKAGIIGDAELFAALENEAALPSWRWLIERALTVKINIVEDDPYESGRRTVLNLGHTFAHAFEVLADYRLPHGMAVSIGLAAAAELAVLRGHLDSSIRDRILAVLERHHLPTKWAGGPAEEVIEAMQRDKKRVNTRLRFVLPRAIGDVYIDEDVSTADIARALERIT
ncbi:MAG: 3-dehydroquinate synthase [Chloroflexi bacterium]|nr:3-dehydroquinate synthase [Chloroflexota bacterium]